MYGRGFVRNFSLPEIVREYKGEGFSVYGTGRTPFLRNADYIAWDIAEGRAEELSYLEQEINRVRDAHISAFILGDDGSK